MTTKRVFISYKREDRPRVKDLAENLEEVGLQVWYDKSIRVGDHWWDTILDQIEQCDVFVFAISQLALRSIPCQREREYAAALGKPFLLIQVGELTAIPNEYATIQFGDFRSDNPRVLTGLIGAINRAPPAPPALEPVPRPDAPIAPLDEIAATLDVEANLDFKDQTAIFYRLKDAVNDPSTKARALELIAVLLQKTLFVPIQTDCRAILEANTPAPLPPPARPRPVLPLIGAGVVGLIVLGISALVFAASNQPKATPTTSLSTTNTSVPVATTAIALLPASATLLPSKSPRPTEAVSATLKPVLPPTTLATELPVEDILGTSEAEEKTQIAQSWTPTPTLTQTQTYTPTLSNTQKVPTFRAITQTAASWTKTPTPTFTPSATYTPSTTPTLIPAGTTLTPTVYARMTIKDVPFVYVPRGCFKMGSDSNYDNEKPQHEVCLTQGFYIGEFEITNAQFTAYEKATGKTRTSVDNLCKSASSEDKQPVVCVSWTEADAYARWLDGSCQLPSEAQWEYAARSPASLVYPWGDKFDKTKANTVETGVGKTSVVGSYTGGQSWVGAQDMAGNVDEWVNDWYDSSYYTNRPKPDNDPTGPMSGSSRALRGGSWHYGADDARAASRFGGNPGARGYPVGFRVVCSAPVS